MKCKSSSTKAKQTKAQAVAAKTKHDVSKTNPKSVLMSKTPLKVGTRRKWPASDESGDDNTTSDEEEPEVAPACKKSRWTLPVEEEVDEETDDEVEVVDGLDGNESGVKGHSDEESRRQDPDEVNDMIMLGFVTYCQYNRAVPVTLRTIIVSKFHQP